MIENNVVLFAFLLTLFAGLSTGIGGLLILFVKDLNSKFLSYSLGFSAGVMLYVSFVEILPKSVDALTPTLGADKAEIFGVLGFFLGIAVIAAIDLLIPAAENPHEMTDLKTDHFDSESLLRMGKFSALAILIHNFPEGLATFVATVEDPTLGISIAIAIAIHNIPEGISVAVPIYYATKSRKKAILYSFASGLAEPIGAIIGYFLIVNFMPDLALGVVFSMVAGIMVYISIDELLPAAQKYGHHHASIKGLIAGMAVMALSLILF